MTSRARFVSDLEREITVVTPFTDVTDPGTAVVRALATIAALSFVKGI